MNRLRTISTLMTMVMIVAVALSGFAQRKITSPPQEAQQEEDRQIRELTVKETDPEMLRIVVPRECKGITPVVQTHDVADNFASPGSAVSLSPALTSYLNGKPVKGYDNASQDRYFADSFKLRSCRVCFATLQIRVKHQAGPFGANYSNYSNDSVTVGTAPFAANQRYIGTASIWNATSPNPDTPTFAITAAGLNNLNNYLFNNTPVVDVIGQDDTDFDWATLSVWYY